MHILFLVLQGRFCIFPDVFQRSKLTLRLLIEPESSLSSLSGAQKVIWG